MAAALDILLQDWRERLRAWSVDGSLASAARHALELGPDDPPLLSELTSQWTEGDFSALPPIVLLPASSMPGAAGAYAISTGSIYLNEDWLETASDERVIAVLTEELGHHLDGLLNLIDIVGDEGRMFYQSVLKAIKSDGEVYYHSSAEDNTGALSLDEGIITDAEFSSVQPRLTQDKWTGEQFDQDFLQGINESPIYNFDLDAANGWIRQSSNGWTVGDWGTRLWDDPAASGGTGSYWGDSATNTAITNGELKLTVTALGTLPYRGLPPAGGGWSPAWEELINSDIDVSSGEPFGYVRAFAETPEFSGSKAIIDLALTDESLLGDWDRHSNNYQLPYAKVYYNTLEGRQSKEIRGSGTVEIEIEKNLPTKLFFQLTGTIGYSPTFTQAFLSIENIEILDGTPLDIRVSSTHFDENIGAGTSVATLETIDPDKDDIHNYSLIRGSGDTDNLLFTLVNNNLVLNSSPDYEDKNSYSIRIASTDSDGLSLEKNITLFVNDVDEAPTDILLSDTSFDENSIKEIVVSDLTAVDQDADDSHTFFLVQGAGDDDNSAFLISGNKLVFKEIANHKERSSYSIRAIAIDQEGLSVEKVLVMTVNDPNTKPTDIVFSAHTFDENIAKDTVIAELTAVDQDAGDLHRFSLVQGAGDDDNSKFSISGNNLVIKAIPDFEEKSSYRIRIACTDNGGKRIEKEFALSVNDLNDTPTDILLSTNTFEENIAKETVISELAAVDQDAGDTHTFSLVKGTGDDDNSAFTILGNKLITKTIPDFEEKSSYRIRIAARDANGLSAERVITFDVVDIDEIIPLILDEEDKPLVLSGDSFRVDHVENRSRKELYDFNSNEAVTWSVGGSDADFFSISNEGVLSFLLIPDFESPVDTNKDNSYDAVVYAVDSTGNTSALPVSAVIANSDEVLAAQLGGLGASVSTSAADISSDRMVVMGGGFYGSGEISGQTFSAYGGYITAFDRYGQTKWTKFTESNGNPNYPPVVSDLSILDDGSVIAVGMASGTRLFMDGERINPFTSSSFFIAKLTPEGTYEWINYTQSLIQGVTTSGNGYITIAGKYSGSLMIESSHAGYDYGDIFLARLNGSGKVDWIAKANSGYGWDYNNVIDVAAFENGESVVSGSYYGSIRLGNLGLIKSTELVQVGSGYRTSWEEQLTHGGFVAKLNSDGTFAWVNEDYSGMLLAGSDGSITILNDSSTLVRLHGDGSLAWTKQVINKSEEIHSIALLPNNEIAVAGIEGGSGGNAFVKLLDGQGNLISENQISGNMYLVKAGSSAAGDVVIAGRVNGDQYIGEELLSGFEMGNGLNSFMAVVDRNGEWVRVSSRPVFISGSTASAIDENSGADQLIYTAVATADKSVTYSLKAGNNDDAAAFSIDSLTGEVTLTADPDYESQSAYAFTVVATDAAGNSSEQEVSLAINDRDDTAPAQPSAPYLLPTSDTGSSDSDNVTALSTPTIAGTAEPGSTINLLLDGVLHPANTAVTTADPVTGEWSYTHPTEHEATEDDVFSFSVTATDQVGNTSDPSQATLFTIDLTAPQFLSGAEATAIDENSGSGQVVYTASVTDFTDVTFGLKAGNADDAAFAIDSLTGKVTLTADPDYETQSSYTFTVVATDAAGNSNEQEVNLTITDLNDTVTIEKQQIRAEQSLIGYRPGTSVSWPLLYSASDNDSGLSGLTLNIHHDTERLTPTAENNGISEQLQADSVTASTIQPDTSDLDGSADTDQMIQLSWGSVDNSFPGTSLPAKVAVANFETNSDAYDPVTGAPVNTEVNFTASETASNYGFEGTPVTLMPESFHLDIDGDGRTTALGDGLMVIRKLFGSAFAGDALTNKAASANAAVDTEAMHHWLEAGIASGDLDVDKDGKTTALGDGLMVIRHMFGSAFAGDALIEKAISNSSPYAGQSNAAEMVSQNIEALMEI